MPRSGRDKPRPLRGYGTWRAMERGLQQFQADTWVGRYWISAALSRRLSAALHE
jgi:hypothetical protein